MNRLIQTRMSLALAIAFGICIAELSSFVAQDDVSAATNATAVIASTQYALPTAAADSSTCEIPLLPLVVVRPSDRDLMEAESSEYFASTSSSSPTLSITNLLPRVRLDMPYYSFGKLMPGATKE